VNLSGGHPASSAVGIEVAINGHAVSDADLRRAFEEASGSDLERFFEQWIYRSGVPELNIKYAWDAERRTAVVQIAQKQDIDEDNPAFEFPLDLYFCNRAHDRLETVAVNSASHTFEFKFDQPPAVFCVDPNAGLLAALRQHKPAALWRNQVRQGPTALVRERAVRKLQSTKDTAAIELLREALFDESEYRGVRQAAAGALPSIADEETCLAALLDLARSGIDDARLRSTVVRLLGDFESSPKAYAAVLRHSGNDEHIRVQAAALTALGRFAEDVRTEAAVRAAAAAALPGNSRYVRRPAVELLGEIGTPGALETLLPAMQSHDRDSLFMMQRLVPLLVDWAEPSPPERARVETYLLMLLSDARPAVRALAAEGLGRVGEAATIDRLSGLAESDGDGTVRRRAQAAIEAIRERDAQEPR
ncbi:MAG: HEAT repeat domain-containing protein, partial [Planctomycetes bacterium]|nr:HEAT repeat domain-containing protein [Planctomycetota bacterium]